MNFWSGLNDVNEISSDSEKDSDKEPSDAKKFKSNPVKDELKIKFENLKQKNVKIKERYTKRIEKRKLKKDITKQQTSDDSIAQITNKCSQIPKSSEQTDEIIKELETKIDSAINSSNIELAEKLSDTLFEEQTKANFNKQNDILNYKANVLDNKSKLENNKTKYKWRFEAKQRWETKSNM
jgi:hypothetical protein